MSGNDPRGTRLRSVSQDPSIAFRTHGLLEHRQHDVGAPARGAPAAVSGRRADEPDALHLPNDPDHRGDRWWPEYGRDPSTAVAPASAVAHVRARARPRVFGAGTFC